MKKWRTANPVPHCVILQHGPPNCTSLSTIQLDTSKIGWLPTLYKPDLFADMLNDGTLVAERKRVKALFKEAFKMSA